MRLTWFAVFGLLCLGTQAQAATAGPDAAHLYSDCQQLHGQGAYERSATFCAAAAEGFGEIAAHTRNWAPYLHEAHSLQLQAQDEAALSHHRLALDTALQAHRLALYVYSGFQGLDPDDYTDIRVLAQQLVGFETVETAYVRRNLGD